MKNLVKKIREQKHLTQAQLADLIGYSPLTISRIERGEIALSTRNADRIALGLGVDATDLFVKRTATRAVPVIGEVQAGEWAESWQWTEDELLAVPVAETDDLAGLRLFAVVTRGPSMNRRYPEGTILIVADIYTTKEQPLPGKRYVVERIRVDGLRETTVKTLWIDENNTAWLVPESTDPRFQSPIPLNGDDGDTIRLLGRVVRALIDE
jgi:transcriptional regulator with XRE-family HTH domain